MEKFLQSRLGSFHIDHDPAGRKRTTRGNADLGFILPLDRTKNPPLALLLKTRCAIDYETSRRAPHRLKESTVALYEEPP